ncbi:unnamed protein product [Lactuca saligna]|uniref:Uncharacterized protein n=1 Tax=Lactuca saligna TaxID=75948 RepID=A0AA35YXG5_LACSI|nr:unnamed protein product [Lactuca saligna]
MLITRLARSFEVLEKREDVMLTVEPQKPFSVLLYKRTNIVVDHVVGTFRIPDDTPCQWVPNRGRQWGREAGEDEPPVVHADDELPMDPYNATRRRYEDYMSRNDNYTNMCMDHFMFQMHVPRPDHFPPSYPHVPTWEELWREQQGGAGGSGGGVDEEED